MRWALLTLLVFIFVAQSFEPFDLLFLPFGTILFFQAFLVLEVEAHMLMDLLVMLIDKLLLLLVELLKENLLLHLLLVFQKE